MTQLLKPNIHRKQAKAATATAVRSAFFTAVLSAFFCPCGSSNHGLARHGHDVGRFNAIHYEPEFRCLGSQPAQP
jgi:hypothetical protein